VSILSDAGRVAGSIPPCPAWCALPPDHDLPVTAPAPTDVNRREHSLSILDDPEVGIVEVIQLDEVVGAAGPVLAATTLVDVDSVPTPLSPEDAFRLADALVRAAQLAGGAR
jgi:hypothetical protein